MSKISEEITTLIRAIYPIIWIETSEELRAISIINDVIKGLNQNPDNPRRTVKIWSYASGLRKVDESIDTQGLEDPLGVLKHVESKLDEATILILKDFHRFIRDDSPPNVYRMLRDMYATLKTTSKTIFIISPIVKIPLELQKSITVVTLPLPEKSELEPILQTVVDGLEEKSKHDAKALTAFKQVTEKLAKNGTKDEILSAGVGLTLTEFEDVLTKSLVTKHDFDISVIIKEKEQIIKKAGILEFYSMEKLGNMADVGGLKALKKWISKRKLAFGEKAKAFGVKTPKGFLLVGAPGTGKSLVAKVTAKYMDMPLIRLDMSEVASKWYGETTNKIKQALTLACAVAPCVFWWDEVEKMFGNTGHGAHEETMRAISTILTWMQELEAPVFIIATCNDPTALNPALMRAGRFDEVFMVHLPDVSERQEIFDIHIRKIQRNPDIFSMQQFATLTSGFSGAEIESSIQDALNNAFFEEGELTDSHILKALSSTVPLSRKKKDDIDRLEEWGKSNAVDANAEVQEETKVKKKISRKFELS